jgi:ABC-type phosphate transport system permease subunit
MKDFFKKINISHIISLVFGLWAINFVQAIIEDWANWSDLHLYNWILLTPGFLLLGYGAIRVLWMLIIKFIRLFRKKS